MAVDVERRHYRYICCLFESFTFWGGGAIFIIFYLGTFSLLDSNNSYVPVLNNLQFSTNVLCCFVQKRKSHVKT